MLRSNITHRVVPTLILAIVLNGCSDDGPTAPRQAFTIAMEAPSYSLKVGETRTTFVKAKRVIGFGGLIGFGMTAGGAGLNTAITTGTADSARVDFTGITAGSYSVVMTGSAPDYATQSLTVPVTVTP
jgi:hypothetical protein